MSFVLQVCGNMAYCFIVHIAEVAMFPLILSEPHSFDWWRAFMFTMLCCDEHSGLNIRFRRNSSLVIAEIKVTIEAAI